MAKEEFSLDVAEPRAWTLNSLGYDGIGGRSGGVCVCVCVCTIVPCESWPWDEIRDKRHEKRRTYAAAKVPSCAPLLPFALRFLRVRARFSGEPKAHILSAGRIFGTRIYTRVRGIDAAAAAAAPPRRLLPGQVMKGSKYPPTELFLDYNVFISRYVTPG